MRLRLDLAESQYRDQVRDRNDLSLSLETESETIELVETKTESLALYSGLVLNTHTASHGWVDYYDIIDKEVNAKEPP